MSVVLNAARDGQPIADFEEMMIYIFLICCFRMFKSVFCIEQYRCFQISVWFYEKPSFPLIIFVFLTVEMFDDIVQEISLRISAICHSIILYYTRYSINLKGIAEY